MSDSHLIHPKPSASPRGQRPGRQLKGETRAVHEAAVEFARVRARYLRDWTLLKRARFNAAQRLKDKNDASLLAFAIAGVVGFVFPFFTLLFADEISSFTVRTFDFVAYITGGLSLTLGLIDQMRDNGGLAKRFHTCGMQVNKAVRQLRNSPAITSDHLDQLVRMYEQALEACDANHDPIDEQLSDAQQRMRRARYNEKDYIEHGGETAVPDAVRMEVVAAHKHLHRTQWRLTAKTYRLYYCVWTLPSIVGIFAWVMLQPVV